LESLCQWTPGTSANYSGVVAPIISVDAAILVFYYPLNTGKEVIENL
jgi:hypothetical protein